MEEYYPWLNTVFRPRADRSENTNRLLAFAKEEFLKYVNKLLQAGDDAEEGLHHPNEVSEEDGKSFFRGMNHAIRQTIDGTNTDPFYRQGTRVVADYRTANKENMSYLSNLAFRNGGQVKRRFGSL